MMAGMSDQQLAEYEAHVLDEQAQNGEGRSVALCGTAIAGWHFTGAGHAFNSLRVGARMLPCPACLRVIRDVVSG